MRLKEDYILILNFDDLEIELKNKNIKRTIKFLYIVCMVFFEIAVMIYFYLEILHGKKEKKEEDKESTKKDRYREVVDAKAAFALFSTMLKNSKKSLT